MQRKVDELGRIVLPREVREELGIKDGDLMDITVHDSEVVMTKSKPSCIFCNSEETVTVLSSRSVCKNCVVMLHDAIQK